MSIVQGMPFSDYLAHPSYGSSDLRTFRHGPPALVPWRRENRDDGTAATRIGAASHATILDPTSFDRSFIVKPPGMEFRTNAAREQRDAWLAAGLEIISQAEADQISGAVAAFHGKEAAERSLIGALGREASVFWDDAHGLPCKGRPDWFDKRAVYDLKVSVEATKGLGTLRYRAFVNGWLGQLAHNRAGLNANGHNIKVGRLVVIAPEPPQGLRVWLLEVNEFDMDVLALENENTSRDMVVCHRSGVWPGTPDEWLKCPLPADHMLADVEDLEGAEEVAHGEA